MNEVTEVTPLSFFEEDITEEINHGIRVSNWRKIWDFMKISVMNWP